MSVIDRATLIAKEARNSTASSRPTLAFNRKTTQSKAGQTM